MVSTWYRYVFNTFHFGGGANSDDWRESPALCLICDYLTYGVDPQSEKNQPSPPPPSCTDPINPIIIV
jgi:hypothetical protein